MASRLFSRNFPIGEVKSTPLYREAAKFAKKSTKILKIFENSILFTFFANFAASR